MYSEIIDQKIEQSLKEHRETDLKVWRGIKAEFLNYKTAKDSDKILTDAVEIKIISKLLAQHKDSIEQFKQGGRFDLVENEEKEAEVLASLLPKEPTEDDIRNAVENALAVIISEKDGYLPSMKDMKRVQELVRKDFPSANGGMIANIFKTLI